MRIKCPTCKTETTWEENPSRPFCSERCRLVDLGRWAFEDYRIPVEEDEEEEEEKEPNPWNIG